MKPRACCIRGSCLAPPGMCGRCTRGMCERCTRGMRKPRKRASSLEAFRFARERHALNPAGARRLAAWALTL